MRAGVRRTLRSPGGDEAASQAGRRNYTRLTVASASVLVGLAGCGSGQNGDDRPDPAGSASASEAEVSPPVEDTAGPTSCVVSLHGKGGDGGDTSTNGGITTLRPPGNDDGWGGRQWNYLDDASYDDAVAVVAEAVDEANCSSVAVRGFSNGGAFAAKLFCQGETLEGRLVGVVIDDPVADAATNDCAPADAVEATLYWTGALESPAPPGTDCGGIDWTCDGGTVIGIEAFAAAAGLDVTPSPFDDHQPFTDAPDPVRWLDAAAG